MLPQPNVGDKGINMQATACGSPRIHPNLKRNSKKIGKERAIKLSAPDSSCQVDNVIYLVLKCLFFLLNHLSVALQGLSLPLYYRQKSSWHATTLANYRNMYNEATMRFYSILLRNAFSMTRVCCLVQALIDTYEFTNLQYNNSSSTTYDWMQWVILILDSSLILLLSLVPQSNEQSSKKGNITVLTMLLQHPSLTQIQGRVGLT